MKNFHNIKDHIMMLFMIFFVMVILPVSCINKTDIELTPSTEIPLSGSYSHSKLDCAGNKWGLIFDGQTLTEFLSSNSKLQYQLVNISKRSRGRFYLEYIDTDKEKFLFTMMVSNIKDESFKIDQSRRHLLAKSNTFLNSFPSHKNVTLHQCSV